MSPVLFKHESVEMEVNSGKLHYQIISLSIAT